MGLLDSNIRQVSDLRKTGVIAKNITDAMNGSANTYNVDCSKFNTCIISVYNGNSNDIPFSIYNKFDPVDAYANGYYVVDEYANKKVKNLRCIAHHNATTMFYVDVSGAKYISIGKGESAAVSFSYELISSDIARDYINGVTDGNSYYIASEIFSVSDVAANNNVKCKNANTTIISITNANAFAVTSGSTSWKLPFNRWWCKELGMFINKSFTFPAGTYTFIGDTHDVAETTFKLNSFSGSCTYILSNNVFDVAKYDKRVMYFLNANAAIGNGDWIKVPHGSKYCIATIVSDTTTSPTVSIFVGYKTDTMLETTPSKTEAMAINRGKAVDMDLRTKPTNATYINKTVTNLLFDVNNLGFVSASISGTPTNVTMYFAFYDGEMPAYCEELLYPKEPTTLDVNVTNPGDIGSDSDYIADAGFTKIWGTDEVDVYQWKDNTITKLGAVMDRVWVWYNASTIYISVDGIAGAKHEITFNSTNFPGLITGAAIQHIILLPYSRNPHVYRYGGGDWRLNVITTTGQVYHNKPSHSQLEDLENEGQILTGDEYKFDESVIWELPERWTPVKTNSGDDATLIATGKYRYFPGYPDRCYEMHPAISHDNGYGNIGFPATRTKGNKTFGRFFNLDYNNPQCNAMSFMGGFAWHEKMCMIGTYRNNADSSGTRICVFLTNDGGRQWFCRYEFGSNGLGYKMDAQGNLSSLMGSGESTERHDIVFNAESPASGTYAIRDRYQILPSAENKEPSKNWAYGEQVTVASIVCDGTHTVVTTTTPHNLKWKEVIYFDKLTQTDNDWDWIVNTGYTDISAGDGVAFKAVVIDSTSFYLMGDPHNPFNPLGCRHIHSVDRCKDGYTISTGERYPNGGWILWMPCKEGDSYDFKGPWSDLEFIRLNSTSTSVYRTLGTQILNDEDNNVVCGIDDSMIPLSDVVLPTGRTATFQRGSQGVWKGKLTDIDDLTKFKNILPTPDVAYGFKVLNGVYIYVGQTHEIAVSFDGGSTWNRGVMPKNLGSEHCHFTGVSLDRLVAIDNLLIKLKK